MVIDADKVWTGRYILSLVLCEATPGKLSSDGKQAPILRSFSASLAACPTRTRHSTKCRVACGGS